MNKYYVTYHYVTHDVEAILAENEEEAEKNLLAQLWAYDGVEVDEVKMVAEDVGEVAGDE